MPNTSDIIMDTLEAWGVEVVFGLPGDGINGLMEALRQRSDKIKFVLVRHEEAAAFAAGGYAKFSGKLGMCLATSGPGAVHLLNGLYDAKLDGQSVLAITGQTYSDLIGSRYQQEIDLLQLFAGVAEYNIQVNSAEHARMVTDLAIRTAIGRGNVAHITIPVDVQEHKLDGDYSKKKVPGITSQRAPDLRIRPPEDAVEKAAEVLNAGKKVIIFAGQGAASGRKELIQLAERLNAPVIKPLLGKDVMPDDHPLCLGGAGLLGTRPSEQAVEDCDTLLMVGTSFPYLHYLPEPGQCRSVQIDIDPRRLGLRYPIEVGLMGDSGTALRDLLPHIQAREKSDWVKRLQKGKDDWHALMVDRGNRDDVPVKPQRIAWELDRLLDDNAIITCDSGTIATWAARYINMRGEQRFSLSGNLATMAPGIPYAIAAQVAHPGRQVVAFIGDGGCMMLGSELSTLAHHGLPVTVVVIDNRSLGMIKWEQMVFLGNPSYGTDLPKIDFVQFAESQGVKGFFIEDPDKAVGTLKDALAHDGPSLVHCVVDPYEPPHPPSIEIEQAINMGKALAKGEPNATKIGLTLFRDKIRDLTTYAKR